MFHLIPTNINVDFLGKSKPFVWLSTALAVGSIFLLFKPGLNYGIDFTGGAEVELRVPADWDTARLRKELLDGGIKEPSVVQIGEPQNHDFLIKVQASSEELNRVSAKVTGVMSKKAPEPKAFEIKRVDVVGPAAGASLRTSAFLSIFYAMILISMYIMFRFDVRYAPGVLRALGVDVLITAGIWVILQREFNLTVLASFLTIAGYSCNDTIVIYDRIRDFSKAHPDWDLERAINKSINLNLGRTVLTVLCTCFVVVSMFALGGPVLRDFSLPMLLGFTISIPSTIFVANPMILYMEKRRKLKAAGGHVYNGTGKKRAARPEPKAHA
ncbi:MAG TPA: protein translocase subunit SecF [Bdellovibrionota bacterium]|nr:protein translocase subunit SecF [Bdellovibrionota bacterium]